MNVKIPAIHKSFIRYFYHSNAIDHSRTFFGFSAGFICCFAFSLTVAYAQVDPNDQDIVQSQRTGRNAQSPLLFPFSANRSIDAPSAEKPDKKAPKKTSPLIINVSPEAEDESVVIKSNITQKKEDAAQIEAQRAEEKARREQEEAQREKERELFWKQYAPTSQETLEIVVVDQATGKYIPEARVTVAKLKQLPNSKIFSEDEVAIGFTNSKGKYRADGVSEGYYVVRINGLPGYMDTEEYATVHPEKITVIGIEVPHREE